MIYVLFGVTAVYAVLSIVAAVVGMKAAKLRDTHITMVCGGAFLLIAAAAMLLRWRFDYLIAVIGGALICAAALVNGMRSEEFHLSHHIVRFALTVAITVGSMVL